VTAAILHGVLDWRVAGPFAAGATAALLLGRGLARGLDPGLLRQAFGWVSLAVALLLLGRALG
jgi:uncharacterized membrane protein YfcA